MSIKESALSAITSITQSDFIRAVTSGGASRRVTVANLAKAIIESYTGSSLAGSSQSVKSAIDSLNSKNIQLTWGTEVTFNCPNNHRFLMIAGSNTVWTGVNYSDQVTFSSVVAGTGSITYTATKSGTSVTITASANTNISIIVF